MNQNETLPDLELVQFGGGRPALGGLEKLKARLAHLLKTLDGKDLLLRDATEQLDLDSVEPGPAEA